MAKSQVKRSPTAKAFVTATAEIPTAQAPVIEPVKEAEVAQVSDPEPEAAVTAPAESTTEQAPVPEPVKEAEVAPVSEPETPVASATADAVSSTTQPPASHERGDVEILFIKSRPKSFRRCGFRFDREGFGIALDGLTEEQIHILKNEPNLVVTRGTATDKAD